MGIRRFVHRGTAYALISIVVLVIYGALIGVSRTAGGSDVSSNLTFQIILLVVLFGATPNLGGTRRLAFAAVDRLLYREYLDHPELTRQLSVDAANARDIHDLTTMVLGTTVSELRLSFAAFLNVSGQYATIKTSVGEIPSEVFQKVPELTNLPSDELVSHRQFAIGNSPGHAILVELRRPAKDAWVLCLGPKVTEEPFSREDIRLAQSIAGHIATVVENLDLIEELQTKAEELGNLNQRLMQTQETERSRIASYLHDEPLQSISNLIW